MPEFAAAITEGQQTSRESPAIRTPDLWIYLGIVVCTVANAVLGPYVGDADPIAYLDISDSIHTHAWHSVINGYWFPLYPAILTVAKAFSGFQLRYELLTAKLIDSILELFFIFSSVFVASSLRRLLLARETPPAELLSKRTLYVWTAALAFFLSFCDFGALKPDSLLTAFLLLTVGFLVRGIADGGSAQFGLAGLFGGLAFWTKAFAFPFFFLCVLCFGLASMRRPRLLRGFVFSLAVFAVVSAPWVWQLSKSRGHFDAGGVGPLATAWYVNGADRFNPVADSSVYHAGHATAVLRHPGELLWKTPEVSYYDPRIIHGSTPQWDDPSYWSEGLRPRLVPSQFIREFLENAKAFAHMAPMRFQPLIFLAVMPLFGLVLDRRAVATPAMLAVFVIALFVVGSFLLVYFQPRYVTFSFILIVVGLAVCYVRKPNSNDSGSLHRAVLLMSALILLYAFQENLQQLKVEKQMGDDRLHGVYDGAATFAGAGLAAHFPPGTEVACVGDAACWGDPYWARYGRVTVSTIVGTGNGWNEKDAEASCAELGSQSAILQKLQERGIRAVIGRFEKAPPCSVQWKPLGEFGQYYYLPL